MTSSVSVAGDSEDVKTEQKQDKDVSKYFYSPPGNQFDVDLSDTEFYIAWQNIMLTMFWSSMWITIQGVVYRLPDYKAIADDVNASDPNPATKLNYLQFRPTHELYSLATTDSPLIPKKITWTGFPKQMKVEFPLNLDAYINAERIDNGIRIYMDEYCEWYSYKNNAGLITKVVLTCEGPEYWEFLFENRPQTCLELYRKYISANVQLKDLVDADGVYDNANKWNNSTQGIMHLNCPPNSLSAEVYLAAESAAYWLSTDGRIITDPQELIAAAEYGQPKRASDPTIGATVNELVRKNLIVSLENPIGLYMEKLKTGGWQNPNGQSFSDSELSSIISYDRGNAESERYLRITIEIPTDAGYVLGNCKIGGVPILYAAQLVDASVTVFLFGLAVDGTVFLKIDAKEGKGGIKPKITWGDSFPPYQGPPLVAYSTATTIGEQNVALLEGAKVLKSGKVSNNYNIQQRLMAGFCHYRVSK